MPVAGQAVLGLNAKTFENTAYDGSQASYDTPTWVERTNVQDVTINQTLSSDVATKMVIIILLVMTRLEGDSKETKLSMVRAYLLA
ncbi:MAG: hypothetical protein ABGX16_21065, partial [Pirellulales bacterium]